MKINSKFDKQSRCLGFICNLFYETGTNAVSLKTFLVPKNFFREYPGSVKMFKFCVHISTTTQAQNT